MDVPVLSFPRPATSRVAERLARAQKVTAVYPDRFRGMEAVKAPPAYPPPGSPTSGTSIRRAALPLWNWDPSGLMASTLDPEKAW